MSLNTQLTTTKKSKPSRSLFISEETLSSILGAEIINEDQFEIKDLWEDFGSEIRYFLIYFQIGIFKNDNRFKNLNLIENGILHSRKCNGMLLEMMKYKNDIISIEYIPLSEKEMIKKIVMNLMAS